jgi:hypothetical protein
MIYYILYAGKKENRIMNTLLQQLGFVLFLTMISVGIADAQVRADGTVNGDTIKYTIDNCIKIFSMDKIEKTNVGYQCWFVDPTFAGEKAMKMSVVAPH